MIRLIIFLKHSFNGLVKLARLYLVISPRPAYFCLIGVLGGHPNRTEPTSSEGCQRGSENSSRTKDPKRSNLWR